MLAPSYIEMKEDWVVFKTIKILTKESKSSKKRITVVEILCGMNLCVAINRNFLVPVSFRDPQKHLVREVPMTITYQDWTQLDYAAP